MTDPSPALGSARSIGWIARGSSGCSRSAPLSHHGGITMAQRLLLIIALAAALVACSPSGTGTSAAPVASDSVPTESMGTESEAPSDAASPSAS